MDISTKVSSESYITHNFNKNWWGPTLVTTRPRLVNTSDVWLLDLVKHATAN